jgi:catecholate siderophore receptor
VTKSAAVIRILLLSGSGLLANVAHAEEASEQDRDYMPGNIVVTAAVDGYASDDGSTATKTPTPLIMCLRL